MKILLISGKQGSGKSTLADTLKFHLETRMKWKVTKVRFAEDIYAIHNFARDLMAKRGFKVRKKYGSLMQYIGTEWGRKEFGDDVWIKCLTTIVAEDMDSDLAIIEDCRFSNEFDAFPEALRVRLTATEETRKARCSDWREDSSHPSEVGLDAYADKMKFDLYFSTGLESPEHCAELIIAQLKRDLGEKNAMQFISSPSEIKDKCFRNPTEFKAAVKVGDTLKGYSTGIEVVVTAIGETRFLYLYCGRESVSKMTSPEAHWEKVETPRGAY